MSEQVAISFSDSLSVFISSTMGELKDCRAMLEAKLSAIHFKVIIFETTVGASSQSIVTTSLREVEASDVFVAIFSDKYGKVTIQEFHHARTKHKPCLVYVRFDDSHRDPKLTKFLKQCVFDPDEGLTYAYFDNAVNLVSRVVADIMHILVTAYRTGDRQVSADAIPRVLRLTCDTIDWYQIRQMHLVGSHHPRDERTTDLILEGNIDIPGKSPVLQRMSVRCIAGRVDRKDADAVDSLLRSSPDAVFQVISDLEVTPAAREIAAGNTRLTVTTIDELIDGTIRFEKYLDYLEEEITKRHIEDNYLPLSCTSERIGRYAAEEGGIDKYVKLWLRDSSKEHLSILGEFGTGKTWFIYHFAWLCMQEYREAKASGLPRPRIPVVVSLRDFAKAVTVESLFSELFFRRHNIGISSYEVFLQLNRMGKFLLLFDGFDEMSARVDKQQMINNFWEFARVLVPGAKVVLTCRTEHFPDAKEGRALLNAHLQASTAALTGTPPQFEMVELEPFTDWQVREVLGRKTEPATVERITENQDLFDMAHRPLMIDLIVEALPDVSSGAPIDLSRIYLYAVRRKMERDIKEERTFNSMADKLYFLCELSWEMLSTEKMWINYREFPQRIRRLFGERVCTQKELDHWHFDMMGQTMLIRNADGDYTPAHRSLLEFFVAIKYVSELGVLADDFTELARRRQGAAGKLLSRRCYTWSSYFQRNALTAGQGRRVALLRTFATERINLNHAADYVDQRLLTRNALAFASRMVAKDAKAFEKLCHIAWDKTGQLAWNALVLFPFLKYEASGKLASMLVEGSGDRPLSHGMAWVCGEFGGMDTQTDSIVVSALKRTIESFAHGSGGTASAWWEAAFALEKLSVFDSHGAMHGQAAINYLIQHLPKGLTFEGAFRNIESALRATDDSGAVVREQDIVAIVKFKAKLNHRTFSRKLLRLVDFSSDIKGKRCYYIAWLLGHLKIAEGVPNLVEACRRHPQTIVRNSASEALGKIGICSSETVEALECGLKDAYFRTRYHAAWSLERIRAISSINALATAIKNEEVRDVRIEMERAREKLISYQHGAKKENVNKGS